MRNISNYKKYANEILDDIETYKMVLNGTLKTFPNRFWTKPYSLESAAIITRYLIEERLKININNIPKVINTKFMVDNKLNGMIKRVFNNSAIAAIENAYPGKFKPWEFSSTPQGYWKDTNNVIKAFKWLIEEKLKWNEEELKDKLCSDTLENSEIASILNICGLYDLINMAYPNRFKPWEFKHISSEFWRDKNNVIKAIKWLIEEKLKWNDEQVRKYYSVKILVDNGLSTLTQYYGAFGLLNLAYPNKFKPWELHNVSTNFWDNKENCIKAIKWFIEEKLKLKSKRDILKYYTKQNLLENGLITIINKYGVYGSINLAYPGLFKEEEFKVGRANIYNVEHK